jgi:hypothetical protein
MVKAFLSIAVYLADLAIEEGGLNPEDVGALQADQQELKDFLTNWEEVGWSDISCLLSPAC